METILIETRAYNVEHQIWPSGNKIIDRLLKRSLEMKTVYDELVSKLSEEQQKSLWGAILGVATCWNLESSKSLREDKKSSLNSIPILQSWHKNSLL